MAYKEDYYEEVDKLFDTIKTNPFVSGDTGNAVSQEDQGQIQPVGWVENADATDGTATVKIDSDGVTITNGALTVENALGIAIIDGVHNMFKIVASGTVTHTQAATSGGSSGISIANTGLPAFETPAYLAYITEGLTPATFANRNLAVFEKPRALDNQFFAADSSGGAVTGDFYPIMWRAEVLSGCDASGDPKISLAIQNGTGSSASAYARFHVLKEAAI